MVFNNSLVAQGEFYYQAEIRLKAEALGEVIGVTTEGDQVFAIRGMEPKDWICLRNAGEEYLYHSSKIKPITDITTEDFSKCVVRDYNNIETILVLDDLDAMKRLQEQLKDELLVSVDIEAQEIKNVSVYLQDYPEFQYGFSYIIDQKGEHYFYDYNTDSIWKFQDHLFDNQ